MGEFTINSARASDLKNIMTDFSVDPKETKGADGQQEFTWQMTDWSINYGYYLKIPEFKQAVKTKATWTVGGGYEAEPEITMQLNTITGNGKDSFNSILWNMVVIKTVGGDAFAEIIAPDGVLINLKPLDPSSIVIVQNNKGMILRYEQTTKTSFLFFFSKKTVKKFKPGQIFHLSRDRVADEIHGDSIVPSVEWIILARNESMQDWKQVMHRNVRPMIIWHLDTDDKTEIDDFKARVASAKNDAENMYIPKDIAVPEIVSIAGNATLNPLTWINQLNDYFFQVVNVPQIIMGNAKEFTDASGKIVYLAYEQAVKAEQLYMEEQVLAQLGLQIKLTFPASLQNETLNAKPNMELENEPIEKAAQPNDTTAELEGKA